MKSLNYGYLICISLQVKYTWYKVTGFNKEINVIKYINLKTFENLGKQYVVTNTITAKVYKMSFY